MHLPTLDEIDLMLARNRQSSTPFLMMDESRLRETCRAFHQVFPDAGVYYSVKANNDPRVLAVVAEEGLGFDIASAGELDQLLALNIPPDKIIYCAPTKIPTHIARAAAAGVRSFAFDSAAELDKLSELAPGAQVLARLAVDNHGADWPLDRKFGMSPEDTLELMTYAVSLGLQPYGITFHVGSQNHLPVAWEHALEKAFAVWQVLQNNGIRPQVIDVGGGFAVPYHESVPDISEYASVIQSTVHRLFNSSAQLWMEPGRAMVGRAGVLVTTVINRAKRGSNHWLYVDAGVFHGLIEASQGFKFPVLTRHASENTHPFILAGVSCDSMDVIQEGVLLPDTVSVGDELYLLSTGAYTNSMERYNGLTFPSVVMAKPF
jgi:ornithine decarboxylase